MKNKYTNLIMKIGIWCLLRVYKQVDVLVSKDRQKVLGITFTSSKKYIDYVGRYGIKLKLK